MIKLNLIVNLLSSYYRDEHIVIVILEILLSMSLVYSRVPLERIFPYRCGLFLRSKILPCLRHDGKAEKERMYFVSLPC